MATSTARLAGAELYFDDLGSTELTSLKPWAAVRDPEGHTIVLIE